MFRDALGLVANAQAVAGADTDVSTNAIDVGVDHAGNPIAIGTGEELGFAISINVAAVTGGGETYKFEIVSDIDNTLVNTPVVEASLPVPAAELVAGALFFIPLPMGSPRHRFLGTQVTKTVNTAAVTYTAALTSRKLFSIAARNYPKNYAV